MTKRQLFMRLPDLAEPVPVPPLVDGYVLRPADLSVEADRDGLAEVLTDAFVESWDAERVTRVLSADEGVRTVYVIVGPQGIAATASARLLPSTYPISGYVHYVGVHTRDRGRRLGQIVTAEVLAHFARSGLSNAVLETDDFRAAAVRTYLRLGFVPEYRAPGDQLRWSRVISLLVAR